MLPNGLCSGPRKFTKPTKPPIACLRVGGVEVAIYIDDIIVTGDTYEECLIATTKTIKLFLKLGFIIHPEKSCLQLSKEIAYQDLFSIQRKCRLNLPVKKVKNSGVLQKVFKNR